MVSGDFDFLSPKSEAGLTEGCQTSNLTFAMDSTPLKTILYQIFPQNTYLKGIDRIAYSWSVGLPPRGGTGGTFIIWTTGGWDRRMVILGTRACSNGWSFIRNLLQRIAF